MVNALLILGSIIIIIGIVFGLINGLIGLLVILPVLLGIGLGLYGIAMILNKIELLEKKI